MSSGCARPLSGAVALGAAVLFLLVPQQAALADYSSEVTGDSPAAYWRLGEASGTSAADETGTGHTGTYTGGPTLGVPGLLNDDPSTAVSFDGSNDYVAVANAADVNTSSTPYEAKTIEAWFKTGTDVSSRQVIWEQGGGSRGANIYLDGGSVYVNVWNVVNDGDGTTPWGPSYVSKAVTTDTRYHVVLVFDRSTDRVEGFLNGVSMGSVSGVGRLFAHGGDVNIARSGNSYFHDGPTGGPGEYFTGTVDEVATYNSPLPSTRVLAHYQAGLSKPTISSYGNVAATVGVPISGQTPSVSGGEPPYSFSVSPSLPAALALDTSTGELSGIPQAVAGTATYAVTVTDQNGMSDTTAFTLSVATLDGAGGSVPPATAPDTAPPSAPLPVDRTAPDRVAPAVERFTLGGLLPVRRLSRSRRRDRAGRRSKKYLGRRSYFAVKTSEPSFVRITIRRRYPGLRYRDTCLPRSLVAKGRRGRLRRCVRKVSMRVIFRRVSSSHKRIRFRGYAGPHRLKPGSYEASIVAVDLAGNRSKQRKVRFRI